MKSRGKQGGITYTLRGYANRQQEQNRERHNRDRAKSANPSKVDKFRNAIKRHHRCSSVREGTSFISSTRACSTWYPF
jgi:hypothetical protein